MPVSQALQDITADVSAWIAAGEAPGRAALEVLRRNLSAAATDARRAEADTVAQRLACRTLITGVEDGVANLAGLARRTREQVGEPKKAKSDA